MDRITNLLRNMFACCCGLLAISPAVAQLSPHLADSTLRIDYIFAGNSRHCEISVDELRTWKGWAGRRVNMDRHLLTGNGSITMQDAETGRTLYTNTFSTLFQEWLGTEEACSSGSLAKAFENVFLLPMPKDSARITIEIRDFKGKTLASLSHVVHPRDILIRPTGTFTMPHRYIWKSGSPEEAIDVAILAEGYTADEQNLFYQHAETAVQALFNHEPFRSLKNRFNVVAVACPSTDSGVSIPHLGVWKKTALSSQFDTFYSERYLTTLRLRQMHDLLDGIPYEHIIILANTDNYGGGGIYNSYTLTTARHNQFEPVVVHEFGHSFAGLADEYYYDDQYVEYYYPDIEPWEQNITTMKDFDSKWKDMIPQGKAAKGKNVVGIYEGGGYQSKGVYRGYPNCRMKTNEAPEFCPVCQRALQRLIHFYTQPQAS